MSGNGELGNEFALSEEELAEVRSYRESHEIETTDVRAIGLPPDGLSEEQLAALSDADIRGMISPQARELVVIQEIGSRAAYDRKYKHPEWPGAQSGVTIGIGYDIGQSGLEDFTRSWQDKLPADAFERLAQTVGVIGPAARPLPRTLQDIEVPWDAAEEVFTNFTAPKYARLVLRHLANAPDLHPHAFGALFSLVYNRGASFGNPGDRYREMRNIRGHMHERKFDLVPEEFRAMKRLWQGQSLAGLLKRRDLEAALFVQGLSAPPIAVAPAPEPAPVPEPTPVPAAAPTPAPVSAGAAATPPSDLVEPVPAPQPVPAPAPEPAGRTIRRALRIAPEADEDWITLERAVERGLEAAPATRGGPSYTANDVSWSADDKNPEYRHLDKTLADREFAFSAKELELVIGASYFQPSRENGVILFGLRGAELVGGPSQINQDVLRLRDARPDHRAFRCVIGAYHVGRAAAVGLHRLDGAQQRLGPYQLGPPHERRRPLRQHAADGLLPLQGGHARGRRGGAWRLQAAGGRRGGRSAQQRRCELRHAGPLGPMRAARQPASLLPQHELLLGRLPDGARHLYRAGAHRRVGAVPQGRGSRQQRQRQALRLRADHRAGSGDRGQDVGAGGRRCGACARPAWRASATARRAMPSSACRLRCSSRKPASSMPTTRSRLPPCRARSSALPTASMRRRWMPSSVSTCSRPPSQWPRSRPLHAR